MDPSTRELRLQAGHRLREWREKRGLSQRELCREVGAQYQTIISAPESGRGRIPFDQYLVWARALGIEPGEFARELMYYYDLETYNTLFCGPGRRLAGASQHTVGDQTQR
jgi:transcriptional regulator with XRE-family HTH domain